MIYSDDEIDAHLVLLTNHIDALQDAIDNNYTVGFNQSNIKSLVQKSKDIIELEKEIRRGLLKILDDCGDTVNILLWADISDALTPVDNEVYVKQGSHSMALGIDADLSGDDYGVWEKGTNLGDLSTYQHDWIYLWVYFSTLAYLTAAGTAIYYRIGSDGANYIQFHILKADLSVGWNLIKCDLDNFSYSLGTINWSNISHQRIAFYEVAANINDFTAYVDSIMFVRPV